MIVTVVTPRGAAGRIAGVARSTTGIMAANATAAAGFRHSI